MKVGRVLKPGAPGTKRMMREFGDRLLLVRYRYDALRCRSIKTVEVIVDEKYWDPDASANRKVILDIAPGGDDNWEKVRQAGGQFDRKTWCWELSYRKARDLNLLDRVISTTR